MSEQKLSITKSCKDWLMVFCVDANWHSFVVKIYRRIEKLSLATEVKKYAVIFYLIQWCNITVVSVVGGVLYSWPCVLALS